MYCGETIPCSISLRTYSGFTSLQTLPIAIEDVYDEVEGRNLGHPDSKGFKCHSYVLIVGVTLILPFHKHISLIFISFFCYVFYLVFILNLVCVIMF